MTRVQENGPYVVTVTEPGEPARCDAVNINRGEQCSHAATVRYVDGPSKGKCHCTRHANHRNRFRQAIDAPVVVSRVAFEGLAQARDAIYDDARPMMCDRCEAPGAPWRIAPSYGANSGEPVSCSCAGGPVDPIPAAGPDQPDYEAVRALFSLPAEGGTVTLLDGTTITVEQTTWEALCDAAEIDRHNAHVIEEPSVVLQHAAVARILAAVNAKWAEEGR